MAQTKLRLSSKIFARHLGLPTYGKDSNGHYFYSKRLEVQKFLVAFIWPAQPSGLLLTGVYPANAMSYSEGVGGARTAGRSREDTLSTPLKLKITVVAEDTAASSRSAQALNRIILEELPDAEVERIRLQSENLDGGATLAVILASPVLLELARALRVFLQRHNSSRISIADERGSLSVANVSAHTVDELVQTWKARGSAC
jgi:hypothetical protein